MGKGNRAERLPLPADVGAAIAAYLRRGRPGTAEGRSVFVRVHAPHRGLTTGGVTMVVFDAAQRAGLPKMHAHRLRHTAATAMLRAGSPLPEVGQVLRHRSPLTTAIYAKVDRDALPCWHVPGRGARWRVVTGAPRDPAGRLSGLAPRAGLPAGPPGETAQPVPRPPRPGWRVTVTVGGALDWARLPANGGSNWWAYRLSAVRGFATYLHAIDPVHEVPAADLLPQQPLRASPYLYSDADIAALIAATRALRTPLRRATFATLIGLLAVTGIRVGEAIALNRGDVDLASGRLVVRHGKFGKARELTLHPTTVTALRRYQRLRDRSAPATGTEAFFVSLAGTRLLYCNVHNAFHRLVHLAGSHAAVSVVPAPHPRPAALLRGQGDA